MISIEAKKIVSSDPSIPAFALQITQLVDSYMLWVGLTSEDVSQAAARGNLCRDWTCAMPPQSAGAPAVATAIFRTKDGDVALSMAQRLAKRLGKQIFLSLDVGEQDVKGIVAIEKGILSELKVD
ncbi:hypothetical protein L218DRAFT_902319 [Marasmius fiardii PR-910]|nr:hypothetical protein L218DRAFT_902319 [Marasmius fiardii PR-910]